MKTIMTIALILISVSGFAQVKIDTADWFSKENIVINSTVYSFALEDQDYRFVTYQLLKDYAEYCRYDSVDVGYRYITDFGDDWIIVRDVYDESHPRYNPFVEAPKAYISRRVIKEARKPTFDGFLKWILK